MTAIAMRTALLIATLIALLGIGGWAFGGSYALAVMIGEGSRLQGVRDEPCTHQSRSEQPKPFS